MMTRGTPIYGKLHLDPFGSYRLPGSKVGCFFQVVQAGLGQRSSALVESNRHAMAPHDARYTPTMPSEPAITVSVEGMKFQQLGSKPAQLKVYGHI